MSFNKPKAGQGKAGSSARRLRHELLEYTFFNSENILISAYLSLKPFHPVRGFGSLGSTPHPSLSCDCLSNCFQLKPASGTSPSIDRRQLSPGWFGCLVITKLSFVAFKKSAEISTKPGQPGSCNQALNNTTQVTLCCDKTFYCIFIRFVLVRFVQH